MSYLLGDSYDQHMALAQGTGAARFIHPDDYCHGYDSQAALDADMPAIAFRRALGYQIDIETGEEFAKTDPFHQGNFPMSHGTKTMAVSVIRWPIRKLCSPISLIKVARFARPVSVML